jgi:hypothetical protein
MMNRLLISLAVAVSLVACAPKKAHVKTQLFGDEFETTTVIPAADLFTALKTFGEKEDVVVEGTVVEVCQEAGCWMKVAANGDTVRVKTGHAFDIPKDIAGRTVLFAGSGYADTLSVEVLRHYAQDAGKTKEEIEAINAPKAAFTFDAKGVKLVLNP